MAPSTEIVIGDPAAQHVVIRPLSRSLAGLFDDWDGNWIDCEVEIAAGAFRGNLRAPMRSEEFAAFLEEVEGVSTTIEGAAQLTGIEGQITLSLTAAGSGAVRLAGEALDVAGTGNRLQFAFDVDPACLPDLSRSLEYLLAAFPVIEVPDA